MQNLNKVKSQYESVEIFVLKNKLSRLYLQLLQVCLLIYKNFNHDYTILLLRRVKRYGNLIC